MPQGSTVEAEPSARAGAPPPARPPQRATVLLALGCAAGVLLAAAGILQGNGPRGASLPPGAVARVGDQLIHRDEYEQALAALARDRRSGVDEEQERYVLDRLIEQELLLQRALELGIARSDLRARNLLTSAMIAAAVAEAEGAQPSEAELLAFYEEERPFLTGAGLVQVRQIWFRTAAPEDVEAAFARAQEATARLRAGDDFSEVKAGLGDAEIIQLPGTPIPATKLADYLGPTAARTAMELFPGDVSDPVRSHSGYHVLQVVDRQAGEPPAFEAAKPLLLSHFRRRAADRALRQYLDDLRRRADVEVATELQ